VEAVDCWETEPSAGIPLNFLERDVSRESGVANKLINLPRALVAAILISTLAFVVLTISRHEMALANLRVETSKMRERAVSVRKTLDRADSTVGNLARLQEVKLARISTLELLEELSRVLPDTVWLSEFRLEGDALDVSGLAKSGAALPPLFARSAIFSEAALTAPLTLDPREDKERFSLRLRIKQPASGEIDDKARKG
jgi:general secretion pathway protein L